VQFRAFQNCPELVSKIYVEFPARHGVFDGDVGRSYDEGGCRDDAQFGTHFPIPGGEQAHLGATQVPGRTVNLVDESLTLQMCGLGLPRGRAEDSHSLRPPADASVWVSIDAVKIHADYAGFDGLSAWLHRDAGRQRFIRRFQSSELLMLTAQRSTTATTRRDGVGDHETLCSGLVVPVRSSGERGKARVLTDRLVLIPGSVSHESGSIVDPQLDRSEPQLVGIEECCPYPTPPQSAASPWGLRRGGLARPVAQNCVEIAPFAPRLNKLSP